MKYSIRKTSFEIRMRSNWVALAAMAVMAASAAPAAAQMSDAQCLTGYNCNAGDVGLHELIVIDVLEPCTGLGDTATVNLRVSAHNNVGGFAYDIGVYLATDGGGVQDGGASCYHTYLAPPLDSTLVYPDDYGDFDGDVPNGGPYDIYRALTDTTTPFFDEDLNSCGDLDALSEVIFEVGPVTLACVDNDQDGTVDVSVGFSNKQNSGACGGVADAIPGTVSKCDVERVNLDGLDVVPVELMSFSIE